MLQNFNIFLAIIYLQYYVCQAEVTYNTQYYAEKSKLSRFMTNINIICIYIGYCYIIILLTCT